MDEFKGGWIANLSDGDTVYETDQIPGDFTPWRKLQDRCKERGLKVTALRLRRGNITLFALGRKLCDGYFQAYEASKSLISGKESLRQGIGAVVGDKVHIVWLSTEGNIVQDIRSLDDNLVHAIL